MVSSCANQKELLNSSLESEAVCQLSDNYELGPHCALEIQRFSFSVQNHGQEWRALKLRSYSQRC